MLLYFYVMLTLSDVYDVCDATFSSSTEQGEVLESDAHC